MPANQREQIIRFLPLRRAALVCLVSSSVVLSDQITKSIAVHRLGLHESFPVVQGLFHFTLVYNTGTAFGLFRDMTLAFILVTVAAVFFILSTLFFQKDTKLATAETIALSLVLGGAVGNLIDRVRLGHVIDFLDFRVWPVFNVADSAITCGAIVLGIFILRSSRGKAASS
jgi:signal peptidase II